MTYLTLCCRALSYAVCPPCAVLLSLLTSCRAVLCCLLTSNCPVLCYICCAVLCCLLTSCCAVCSPCAVLSVHLVLCCLLILCCAVLCCQLTLCCLISLSGMVSTRDSVFSTKDTGTATLSSKLTSLDRSQRWYVASERPVMSCNTMLCHAILCYVIRCYAMLCKLYSNEIDLSDICSPQHLVSDEHTVNFSAVQLNAILYCHVTIDLYY